MKKHMVIGITFFFLISSLITLTQASNNLPSKQTDATWHPSETANKYLEATPSPVNFTLKWSASVGIFSTLQPLMHDVDADGIMEIFMIGTTDGKPTSPARLICIKGDTGALVYQKDIDTGTGGGTHRPLVIADAFNDGKYQVFFSGDGYGTNMTCIWATNGTMLWHMTLAGAEYHIFSGGDTDRT